MKIVNLFIILLLSIQGCTAVTTPTSTADPISHSIWDGLLKKHVDNKGFVNYAGFKKDQAQLKKYLTMVEKNAPAKSWSKDEELTYWINAYNAFTIQLILDNADKNITSIKDIGSKIKIPFVNTPWDVKFINIGGDKMDLNNIEHGIIRKKFKEPRIHFALVCAAMSCPPLRNEAFTAKNLDKQLQDQGEKFINDASKNKITPNSIKVTKILDWYGGDFNKSKVDIVNDYSKTKVNKDATVSYMDYNWALNGKL
jgi:hypothetical protein